MNKSSTHFCIATILALTYIIGSAKTDSLCSLTGFNLVIDPSDCTQFYKCWNGMGTHYSCDDSLIFNPTVMTCTWPSDSCPEIQKFAKDYNITVNCASC